MKLSMIYFSSDFYIFLNLLIKILPEILILRFLSLIDPFFFNRIIYNLRYNVDKIEHINHFLLSPEKWNRGQNCSKKKIR